MVPKTSITSLLACHFSLFKQSVVLDYILFYGWADKDFLISISSYRNISS